MLQTDASDIGIGEILYQENKIVGIYSKKLSQSEKNYTTPKKELYAIIKSLENFKDFIWCSRIDIETDSKNISLQKESNNARINRWNLVLGMYDTNIKHIPGKENIIADHLSRVYEVKSELQSLAELKEQLAKIEIDEGTIKSLKLKKEKETGIFYDQQEKVYIPDELDMQYLKYLHAKLVHAGESKLYYTVKNFIT